MPRSDSDINFLQDQIAGWADSVYPDRTVHQALTKLVLEEIPEFIKGLDDPGEYADLLILILDIAYLKGIDVGSAVLNKMAKNKKRKWLIDNETGLMHHITGES